ncbi:MAG: WxL domain-containing protein [Liquorilactobacillus nagelii]|jgi:hypothetical protein|uniref:WxL domain-containing protein n=1 Tax=Liquorilactobacillus nagelii TaxID=82688 RepID=UPI002431C1F6|nr:WxL domain-containing protein [Liquorilactobacillus nagelii]MCI1633770.1 WxL domain-containing protein [Liquorilactobacillus nagelii]
MKKNFVLTIVFSLCALVFLPLTTKADTTTTDVSFTVESGGVELAQVPKLNFGGKTVPQNLVDRMKTSEVTAYQSSSSQKSVDQLTVRDYRGSNSGWSITAQVGCWKSISNYGSNLIIQKLQLEVVQQLFLKIPTAIVFNGIKSAALKRASLRVNKNNLTDSAKKGQVVIWTLSNTASDINFSKS